MESENIPSFPWMDTLLSYFKNLKQLDDEIEQIRVSLCEISQFSPLSLFNYLDIDSKSFLTLNDFISFLRSQHVTYDERKLRKMIHNFDKDSDFSINLDEFLGLILPRKNSALQKNILSLSHSYYNNNNNNITKEITSTLADLLIREMELIKNLDDISRKIKNSKIFSTYEAFMAIVGEEKYMTKLNLNNFLKENGVYINSEEAAQLMFRLDADNDDRISYEEFKEIFYPIKDDFVYSPKDDVSNSNSNIFNYNKKYEKKTKYTYISNSNNNNNNNYINTEKDYDYNNNDYDDNNMSNSDNDYNNSDNDYNEKKSNGKKGKKTKKVILKKADESNNLIHSQDQNDNNLKNYQQESYSKYPNINNHNSTDNYTLNKNNKFNKNINYNNIETEENNTYNNEYNYNSKITQKSLIMSESNNKNSINKYKSRDKYNEIEDNQIPDNDDDNDVNDNYNSYESKNVLRVKNKKKYSSNNNYGKNNNNDDDDDDDHEYKSGGCKACLYTARNIYKNIRDKNNKSSPLKSFEKKNNYSNNNYKKERNYIPMTARNFNKNSYLNNQDGDIYKRKAELLKKYGNYHNDYNNNDKDDDYLSNSEEHFSTKINKRFSSSPKKVSLNNNDNNDLNNNDEDDYYEKEDNNNNINNNIKKKNIYNNRFQKIKDTTQIKDNIYEKRKLLFKLLQNFIEQENKLEKIKESLASCSDASFSKIFAKFNQKNKNLIFSSDLYDVLNAFSSEANFTPNDIKYILKKYNKSIESGFNYNEFCNIISPKKLTSKIILENRDKSNTVNENKDFDEETKNKIVEFFEQLIDGEKSSEEIRTMINMADDSICNDLFGGIKKENKPGIEKDDIDKFMRENGYNIKDYEISIIMEKMDKNKDGKIDYGEFISEITPKII